MESEEHKAGRKAGHEEMRKACVALINAAREKGESDLRQVREWIDSCELDESGKLIPEPHYGDEG